jgi:hypothetical protein
VHADAQVAAISLVGRDSTVEAWEQHWQVVQSKPSGSAFSVQS